MPKKKATTAIEVCLGSHCADHKGRKVAKRIRDAIAEADAESRLQVRKCGCLKRCKHGPVVTAIEGALCFDDVRPKDAERIVRKVLDSL